MAESGHGRGRGVWWAAAAVALATFGAVAVAVVLLVSGGGSGSPATRARVYSSFQACLVTGARGIADPQAAPVWAGMEDASLRTRAMVSYLAVTGPSTEGNALSFVNSLVLRHCDVIVASGTAQLAAALADAHRFTAIRFVLAGSGVDGPAAGANVTVVPAGAAARSAIASVVAADVAAAR